MKKNITRNLFMIFTIMFVSSAFANIEVNCFNDDCLTSGWQSWNLRTGDSALFFCTADSCLDYGWQTEHRGYITSEAVCKSGGCFGEGWSLYHPRGGLLAEVTCHGNRAYQDCFTMGWTTYEVGRGSYLARCINGDCIDRGWDVIVNGYVAQAIRCKVGGCFKAGWIVYQ